MTSAIRAAALLASLVVGGACTPPPAKSDAGTATPGDDDDDDDDGGVSDDAGATGAADAGLDPATVPLRGACETANRIGGFIVEEQSEYSIVDGKIADAVIPQTVYDVVMEEGGCALVSRRNPFCNPPCAGNEVCGLDETCQPYPLNQDVGVVTITGLAEPVLMEPLQPGTVYFDTSLPQPGFAEGSAMHLTSTAGRFGALDLYGVGPRSLGDVAPLWTLTEGEPLVVAWNAPPDPTRSTVTVSINVDQHGNTPVLLSCDFPDTGIAEVPSSLIDALITSGVSGFPNGGLSRHSADKLDVDEGCIDLLVGSPRRADVRVAGFQPCMDSEACPSGQTCNLAVELCE